MATPKLILVKKEVTYGTDAVPTVAANARLSRNLQIKPIVTDQLERNLDRQVRGRSRTAPTNARKTVSYELELAGSGNAGTAPAWMEDLEICGAAAPALVAVTSATQRFAAIGTALSSGTVYDWDSGQKSIGLGGRGTFGWDFTANAYPFVKIDLTLLLPAGNPLSDNVPGAATLDQWKDPLEVNTVNTDFTLDGYAAVLKSWTGDVNAEVKARNLVGANSIQRGNHAITGKIVIEAPALASKDYFLTLRTGAEIVANLVHGTVAGNIIEWAAAHLQITDIDRQEEDDVLMLSISYGMNVGTTNDDLVMKAR